MRKRNFSLLIVALTGLFFSACAQIDAEHKGHHPDDKTPAAAADRSKPAGPGANAGDDMAAMQGMDRHMKAMQDLRARMAATKTPAEREALMVENSKLMQAGMAMMRNMEPMQGMGSMSDMRSGPEASGDIGHRIQMMGQSMEMIEKRIVMMEKRMEMMQSMMQMVMDRLPSPIPGEK